MEDEDEQECTAPRACIVFAQRADSLHLEVLDRLCARRLVGRIGRRKQLPTRLLPVQMPHRAIRREDVRPLVREVEVLSEERLLGGDRRKDED